MKSRLLCALGAALALAGCEPVGGSEGLLGHGMFFYDCVNSSDIACGDNNQADIEVDFTTTEGIELPRAVAVGAPFLLRFESDYDADNGGAINASVEPASPKTVAANAEGAFAVLIDGTVSFLAMGADGTVVDLIDLLAEPVDSVHVFQDGGAVDSAELSKGDVATVQAAAFGSSGTALGGSLTWAWSSSDESVAMIEPVIGLSSPTLTPSAVMIVAKRAGSTEVTAAIDGKKASFTVDVQ